MKVVFSSQADKDWRHWEKHNPAVLDKIRTLLHEIEADPFKGTGKPESLKENWRGYWSQHRRASSGLQGRRRKNFSRAVPFPLLEKVIT